MENRWQRRFSWLFITLPILSLSVCAISWLRYGIDLPLLDDWREYNSRMLGSFDFSYLFTSANDTLYPVGKFLDSLAYRRLNGNAVAYQLISMLLVLGLALYYQWRLLSITLKNRVLSASAFSFTLLMLQPDSYWGWQNMAFHQGIPVVCILASVYLLLRDEWNAKWAIPTLFLVGLISGFSYISGAFSILAVSIIWLFTSLYVNSDNQKRFRPAGISLFCAGIITASAQFWVIAVKQKGTHRADAPMGYPFESDFWFFLLGKLGRSLMLPSRFPALSLVFVIVLVLISIGIFLFYFKPLIEKKFSTLNEIRPAIAFISIFGAVFVYLCLIAAGRVNLRPIEIQEPTAIFAFGFQRFHFFWATILWPWVVAAGFLIYQQLCKSWVKKYRWQYPVGFAAVSAICIISAGSFDHARFFKNSMLLRAEGVKCMLTQLQLGGEVYCPQIDIVELSKAYSFGKDTGASFVRTIPFISLPSAPDQTAK